MVTTGLPRQKSRVPVALSNTESCDGILGNSTNLILLGCGRSLNYTSDLTQAQQMQTLLRQYVIMAKAQKPAHAPAARTGKPLHRRSSSSDLTNVHVWARLTISVRAWERFPALAAGSGYPPLCQVGSGGVAFVRCWRSCCCCF